MPTPTRRAWATIDCNALRHNLARVRTLCPAAAIYAVIKSNAYGHGMAQVAQAITSSATPVAGFAVATLEEALTLRTQVHDLPILLLNGFVDADEAALCLQQGIEPVVHSAYQVSLLAGCLPQSKKQGRQRIWIKFNSGMNRLGMSRTECLRAITSLAQHPHIEPIFMSHLAYADDMDNPASKSFTAKQLQLFQDTHLKAQQIFADTHPNSRDTHSKNSRDTHLNGVSQDSQTNEGGQETAGNLQSLQDTHANESLEDESLQDTHAKKSLHEGSLQDTHANEGGHDTEAGVSSHQGQLSQDMANAVRAAGNRLKRSLAASAGILTLPSTHLDLVRPGVMLYGSSPLARQMGPACDLQAVMTLSSRLIAINDVGAGESIGYNATYTCTSDSRIGVVSIGYGDGYPRSAENATPVLVRTASGIHRCPLIGRVSMDMITIDLSAVPAAQIDDEVVLWGDELPADEVARHANTIAYELFCKVTSRVNFHYENMEI